jgi:septal ring factor EnvC (AmiA/AmiB activator)
MDKSATLFLVITASLLFGAGAVPALANDGQDVRRKIKETEKSIAAGQAQKRVLSNQAQTARDRVDGLRIRAAIAAHETQQEEAVLSATEERLAVLLRQDKDYRHRLGRIREGIARSITALIRMERQPAAAFLLAPGTILDTARGGRLLVATLPLLRADADEVSELLAAAREVRDELSGEQQHHLGAVAALTRRRQELQALLQQQARSEQQLRQAGATEGKRLATLAAKAVDLRALMQRLSLDEQLRRDQEEQISAQAAGQETTRKAAGQTEERRRKFAAGMARALSDPKANEGGGDNRQDTPSKRQRLAMAPGQVPFSKIRGRLRLPAKGKRIGQFGKSSGFGPRAQGITLRTRQEAQVVVPYDGQVVFAGPFRDYGLMLIISYGEGYHTLLAGLAVLQAVVGQSLLTGEPIGRMGGDDKRSLYIELRHQGVAINPNPWWSSRRKRASG